MKKILLDTNAYAQFKLGNEDVKEIIQYADTIGISTIVLGELLAGFEYGSQKANNLKELDQFLSSSRVEIYPVETTTARYYAKIYSALRKKGQPIPTNDLWIAATTLQTSSYLCSFDKHFREIEELIVVNNFSDFLF